MVVESMDSEKSRSDQPPPPIPVAPPPSLNSPPPMPPGLQSSSPPVEATPPVPNPQPLQWSDEQLISQGWTTEQITTILYNYYNLFKKVLLVLRIVERNCFRFLLVNSTIFFPVMWLQNSPSNQALTKKNTH